MSASDHEDDEILITRADGVMTLTLNRPASLNALTGTMMATMVDILTTAASDPDVGCIVVTGAGRAFCAGADVKVQSEGDPMRGMDMVSRRRGLRRNMEISLLLHGMHKPTIAALNGVAAGAGLGIALACDFRIAARAAIMTTAFARVGLPGDFGCSYFLPRLVGWARAMEFMMLSEKLTSEDLLRHGLVNWIVDDADLDATARALAARLASGPRVAIEWIKRNAALGLGSDLPTVLDAETDGILSCLMTQDHLEAARAFVEKRPARFKGR